MSRLKAVVLEKNNNTITVLTGEGAFQTLKYKKAVKVGEEILLPTSGQVPFWRIGASIAAVFLLTVMGIFGWNAFQPRTAVAMISLDINPSLQLTVDQKGEVLELESMNIEAQQLMASLSLIGMPWGEALDKIIQESVTQNYLSAEQNWVVIGYSPVKQEKEPSSETINPEKVSKQVQKAVSQQGLKPALAVYELTPEQKQQAQETGLSLGEYALKDTAQKAGIEVKPEALKKKEELKRLLENPEFQEQLRNDKKLVETMSMFFVQDPKEINIESSLGNKDKWEEKLKPKNDKNGNTKEQPLKDRGTQGNYQDKDKNSRSDSKGNETNKLSDNPKKNEENSRNNDSKGSSRGNNDYRNIKDKDKGQSDLKRNNDSKNQNKSNKNDKPTERNNKNNYQESWKGMDIRSVLRMTYSR